MTEQQQQPETPETHTDFAGESYVDFSHEYAPSPDHRALPERMYEVLYMLATCPDASPTVGAAAAMKFGMQSEEWRSYCRWGAERQYKLEMPDEIKDQPWEEAMQSVLGGLERVLANVVIRRTIQIALAKAGSNVRVAVVDMSHVGAAPQPNVENKGNAPDDHTSEAC